VLVEDDDISARESIAAKLTQGLSHSEGTNDATVTCHNRATTWWLALATTTEDAARKMAQEITITDRRDEGLLLNPNYQHAEFISVQPIGSV